MHTIIHQNQECYVHFGTYDNGRTSIQLVTADTLEPWAKATVNLPDFHCPPGHVFIKSWSENSLIEESLVSHGIIEDALSLVHLGQVDSTLHKVAVQDTDAWNKELPNSLLP